MQKMQEFRFGALWFDQGIRHPRILGSFNKSGALVAVRPADDANGNVEWHRQAEETPDGFERRVTGDLLELMGVAGQSSIESQCTERGGAMKRQTCLRQQWALNFFGGVHVARR